MRLTLLQETVEILASKKERKGNTVGSVEEQSFGAGNYVTSVWRYKLAFKGVNGIAT